MQHTINSALLQTTSKRPSNGPLSKPFVPSELQATEARKFKALFPSDTDVLAFFAPVKWADATANPTKCLMLPSVTLAMLDKIYGKELAFSVVVNNIVGLFTMGRPREAVLKEPVELTARLFIGKFGNQLSMFGMLLFFADYLTEYKSSFGQFDLPDVLRTCAKTFMPRWNARLGAANKQADAKTKEGCKEVGKPALYRYLRREYVERGIDVRTSPLVIYGCLTEKELKFIESGEEPLL